ncbi:unnamed protein product [Protopolystoma xenopodis]|uniref:Uncharacterized protein n=1 Tax=Protopolystoma xenopodis TaxID=117903 RepID=A0A448XLV0_9PLAT|nr:unnamed protein product [Protopolystoma xenopodis]
MHTDKSRTRRRSPTLVSLNFQPVFLFETNPHKSSEKSVFPLSQEKNTSNRSSSSPPSSWHVPDLSLSLSRSPDTPCSTAVRRQEEVLPQIPQWNQSASRFHSRLPGRPPSSHDGVTYIQCE